jgi:hypothetical protein
MGAGNGTDMMTAARGQLPTPIAVSDVVFGQVLFESRREAGRGCHSIGRSVARSGDEMKHLGLTYAVGGLQTNAGSRSQAMRAPGKARSAYASSVIATSG